MLVLLRTVNTTFLCPLFALLILQFIIIYGWELGVGFSIVGKYEPVTLSQM